MILAERTASSYWPCLALDLAQPTDAITARDRLALVTVTIRGTLYVIVEIGLRMLQRHELYSRLAASTAPRTGTPYR